MKDYCSPQNISLRFTNQQTSLAANLTFIVYTLFVMACASCFVVFNKRKLRTLQMKFNAGGEMSMSLLTSTIVSQWTWASNLLGSTTVGIQV